MLTGLCHAELMLDTREDLWCSTWAQQRTALVGGISGQRTSGSTTSIIEPRTTRAGTGPLLLPAMVGVVVFHGVFNERCRPTHPERMRADRRR